MSRDLPALRALVSAYPRPLDRPRVLLVTHVLPTAVGYIDCLARVFDLDVIAIPYSSCPESVEALRRCGHRVSEPPGLEDIPVKALEAIECSDSEGVPVAVQEIGGYLAAYAARLGEYGHFLGIVEDTNNGHWRYAEQAHELSYPVVSIAKSPIKGIEDAQVGHAVAYSVERLLRESFHGIVKGIDVLVLGFGSIGSSCAEALRCRGANVAIFDVDPIKVFHARVEGYHVGGLSQLLQQADVVIGATGRCALDRSSVRRVKQGALLVSASSRQVEFDVAAMKQLYAVVRAEPDLDLYSSGGHSFYVARDGYPINFRDYSILGSSLDGIYSELFVCLREVIERRAGMGLKHSWAQLHREVAEAWLAAHGVPSPAPEKSLRVMASLAT